MKELYIDKSISNLLKFCAAIMVALHHYSQYVLSNDLSNNFIYKLFSTQGGYMGVAIFFFLSGYGLMKSEMKKHLNFPNFIRKRILKVYVPVILCTIIWLPVYYIFIESPNDFFSVLNDLFWGFKDSVFWFIKPLLFLYITFFVFSELITRANKQVSYTFLMCMCIIVCYFQYKFADYTMISIPFFVIGVLSADYKDKNWGNFNVSLLYLVLICISVLLCLDTIGLILHALFNYIVVALFLIVVTKYRLKIKDYTLLGVISFDIYLVHNKIITVAKVVGGGVIFIYNYHLILS